jgi:hypothetical protein
MSKAYVTALGLSILHVIDMKRFPYRMKAVEIPECKVLEDAIFTADNKTWYLTCMGSQNIIVGDATTDKPIKTISLNNASKKFYTADAVNHRTDFVC